MSAWGGELNAVKVMKHFGLVGDHGLLGKHLAPIVGKSTGDRTGSGQDIGSYVTSLYGSYVGTGWYVDGALSYGIHKYDAKRQVAIAGASAQTLSADYSGRQMGAKAEIGVPLAVGPAVVTPWRHWPTATCIRVATVSGTDHDNGWVARWRDLLSMAPIRT